MSTIQLLSGHRVSEAIFEKWMNDTLTKLDILEYAKQEEKVMDSHVDRYYMEMYLEQCAFEDNIPF